MLRRYVQLSGMKLAKLIHETQGKGKTPKEILKRIDYGGIIATLVWVCEFLDFLSNRLAHLLPQVLAVLLFLSYRYNEQLPVG
jgi:hypothetical protein